MVLGGALAGALMWLYLVIPPVLQIPCYGSITTANHTSIQTET